MSFYDDASLVFLAGGAAGKDGKIYNLKPTGRVTTKNFVDNGTFDSATNWVADAGWSIADGKASTTGAQIGSIDLVQTTTYANLAQSRPYKLQYTVSDYAAGTLSAFVRGTAAGTASANGTYTEYAIAGSDTDAIKFTADVNFRGKIDDVSIVEVESIPADFTFTRGSNLTATRVGKDGYIEKGRENLLLQSNQFDTTWGTPNTAVTSGQSGYDGSLDAWLLEADNAASSANVNQGVSISGVMTASIYAKEGTTNWFRFSINDSGVNSRAWFDLSGSGAVGTTAGTIIDTKIESAGNGYFRCSITFNATAANLYVFMANADNSISYSVGDNIYIQDAQLEQGLVATDYIETGAATATAGLLEDEPRFDYTGGGCPALLMEPARTNKLAHSEYFNDYWAAQDASVTDNATTSPEGLVNASKLIPDSGTGGNRSIGKNFTGLSGIHTFSVFAKAAGHDYIALRMRNPGNGFAMFNLSDGSVENEVSGSNQYVANSAKIESFGNDWYRCSASFDPSQSTTVGQLFVSFSTGIDGTETSDFDGDGTNGVFIYGAHLEEGEFTTSYIPTYGSSATRDQDVTTELEHGITMGTTCSVFFEGKHLAPDITQLSFFQLRTDDNNRLLFFGSGTTSSTYNFLVQHRVSGTSTNATSKALNIGDSFKVLARMDDTTMDVFINGELHDTKTITAQDHFGKMNLYRTNAADQSGHEVSQAILFTTALSNNDSEILTGATSYRSFNVMASALNYTIYE